jgi:hypothetical protein
MQKNSAEISKLQTQEVFTKKKALDGLRVLTKKRIEKQVKKKIEGGLDLNFL